MSTNTSSVKCIFVCLIGFDFLSFISLSSSKYVKTSLSEPWEDCWQFVLQFVSGRVHLSEVCRLFAEEAWYWSGHVCISPISELNGMICFCFFFVVLDAESTQRGRAQGLCTDKSWVDDV